MLKKIQIGVLLLFLLFAGLQSRWSKEFLAKKISETLSNHGWRCEATHLDGILPNQLTLASLELDLDENTHFSLQGITLRLGILSLLQNEISINYLGVESATITYSLEKKKSFDHSLHVRHLRVGKLTLINSSTKDQIALSLEGSLTLRPESTEWTLNAHLLDDPKTFLQADYHLADGLLSLWAKGELHSHLPFEGSFEISLQDNVGTLNASSGPFQLSANLFYDPLLIKQLTLSAPETYLTGDLSLSQGDLIGFSRNLEALFPDLSGRAGIRLHFDGSQATLFATVNGLRYKESLCDELLIEATLDSSLQGNLSVQIEHLYTPRLSLDHALFTAHSKGTDWPFVLKTRGRLDDPLSLHLTGTWSPGHLLLSSASGELLTHPLTLAPFSFDYTSHSLKTTPFRLSLGSGELTAKAEITPDLALLSFNATHLPIVFGSITASGDLRADPEHLSGSLNLVLEKAKGTLQAHLEQNTLQIHSELFGKEQEFAEFSATLPIQHSLAPFRLCLNRESPFSAQLTAEGALEHLFDFINIGSQRISGLLSTKLYLSSTLSKPSLDGTLELQHGGYENDITGTQILDVDASATAHKQKITLRHFTATDGHKGRLIAEGSYEFPSYALTVELDSFRALHFSNVDCSFTGPVYLTGNSHEMSAKGSLVVPHAHLQIPESLPIDIPSLPITYVNRPSTLQPPPIRRPFPFHFDLDLASSGPIEVTGRGLESQWQGEVQLTGTNSQVHPVGTLKLIKGDFHSFGKIFKLTDGEILFKEGASSLNLHGTLDLPDMTVTATLRGPLNSPILTFQSNPQQPTSSILARILFNKEMSDISQPEALQLATVLVNLSGGAAPNVLETLRRSLGVDRLSVASTRDDELSLQIGKYLTRGVLITLSQSATSTQVIVEVELPKGFIFQAQTQEVEEGKFTLKWQKNY